MIPRPDWLDDDDPDGPSEGWIAKTTPVEAMPATPIVDDQIHEVHADDLDPVVTEAGRRRLDELRARLRRRSTWRAWFRGLFR